MAARIAQQIEETEEEKRLYVKELLSLNKWITKLEEKKYSGESLTDDEKADLAGWRAERNRVRQSSNLLTQRLERLAADAKELATVAKSESCSFCVAR